MRIKKLKLRNYSDIKELDVAFSKQDNIISIRKSYDVLFGTTFLEVMQFLFFDDSSTSAKCMVSENTVIECTTEKDGIEYTFGVKGNYSRKAKDGYVCMRNVLNWYCIVPEKELLGENGGWLCAQLSYEPQEYFYPKNLETFSNFTKDTNADSPITFIYDEVFEWLKLMAKYNKRQVDLEKKLYELIDTFGEVKIDDLRSIRLNEDKDYALFFNGEEVTETNDLMLVNFFGWINNLNILKGLCEYVGEDWELPIFIENIFGDFFERYKGVLIEKLRKTERQVFLFLNSQDENVEKYCDKVVTLNID